MNLRVGIIMVLVAGGCSSSGNGGPPVDVTGEYTGPVTNGANSCPGLWDVGKMSDATATVAQTGGDVSVRVQGAAGLLLGLGFGTNTFAGSVSGSHIDAVIIGSVSQTRGGCMYTSNGHLTADLNGNTLAGSILYSPQANGNPDCDTMGVTNCSSQQTFALNRPPK